LFGFHQFIPCIFLENRHLPFRKMVAPAVRSTNRQVSGEQDHSTMSRGVMTRRSQGAMALVSE